MSNYTNKPYYIRRKIYENADKKSWKTTDKVYGLYDEDGKIVYIGKSIDIEKRLKQHKNQYKNHTIKELRKGKDEKMNWEIVYIQWYGLKYELNNKLHKLKQYEKEKDIKENFNKYEYKPKFKDYKKYEYMYLHPIIQKFGIIQCDSIFKNLKNNITCRL